AAAFLAQHETEQADRAEHDPMAAGTAQLPLVIAARRDQDHPQSTLAEQARAHLLAQAAPSSAAIGERTLQATRPASPLPDLCAAAETVKIASQPWVYVA